MTPKREPNIDQQLVERVQRGDKNAFNLLVTKYQHKVASLVSRYVRNNSDVPDIVQEAFIKRTEHYLILDVIVLFILGYIESR